MTGSFEAITAWSDEQAGDDGDVYNRPLGWYTARLREAGLAIDTLDEPLPDEEFAARRPRGQRRQLVAPSFLILGARRVAGLGEAGRT